VNNKKAAIKLETEIVARGKPSSPRICPAKTGDYAYCSAKYFGGGNGAGVRTNQSCRNAN